MKYVLATDRRNPFVTDATLIAHAAHNLCKQPSYHLVGQCEAFRTVASQVMQEVGVDRIEERATAFLTEDGEHPLAAFVRQWKLDAPTPENAERLMKEPAFHQERFLDINGGPDFVIACKWDAMWHRVFRGLEALQALPDVSRAGWVPPNLQQARGEAKKPFSDETLRHLYDVLERYAGDCRYHIGRIATSTAFMTPYPRRPTREEVQQQTHWHAELAKTEETLALLKRLYGERP